MTTISLDEHALEEARRFNQKLSWAPRFHVRYRFTPLLLQGLLRLSQVGGTRGLIDRGYEVEQQIAAADGLSVPFRILRPVGPISGVMLDVHGGGWIIGNAPMNDA